MRANQNIEKIGLRIQPCSDQQIVTTSRGPLNYLCLASAVVFLSLIALPPVSDVFALSGIGGSLNSNTDDALDSLSASSGTPQIGSGGQPQAQAEFTQEQGYSLPPDFTTFEDPDYGIRISYPSDWTPTEMHSDWGAGMTSIVSLDYVGVYVEPMIEGVTSLDQFTSANIAWLKDNSDEFELISSDPNIYLGGMPASMIIYTNEVDGEEAKTLDVYIKVGDYIFTVRYYPWAEDYDLIYPTAEQVINSFEFIDMEQPSGDPSTGGGSQVGNGGEEGFAGGGSGVPRGPIT